MLVFTDSGIGIVYLRGIKKFHIEKEESNYSREFWMFIGSLVFFLSVCFIIIFTSLPVINKIFNTNFTVGAEVEFFYNRIQVFVAVVLGCLLPSHNICKYKNTDKKYFVKKIASHYSCACDFCWLSVFWKYRLR